MRRYKLSGPLAGLVALIAFLCVLPLLLREYHLTIATLLLINIIMVASFRLITTIGGWNLAHFPLMGAGAYFSTIMVMDFGWPFWVTMPLAGLVAALVGLGFSYPLARMRGFAFFIGSYAMGEALRLSFVQLRVPFRGVSGIINIPPPSSWSISGLPTIDFHHSIPYYFLVLVVMLVCLFIMYRLDRSLIGDTFKAIYSHDLLAKCVGINITRYKTVAYVIGSAFAGVAGALLAHYLGTIDTTLFGLTPTVYLLIWVVVGGTHTFAGPIIGVSVLTGIVEVLRAVEAWRPLVYGSILIPVLLFLPHGFESLPAKIASWTKKLRNRVRN